MSMQAINARVALLAGILTVGGTLLAPPSGAGEKKESKKAPPHYLKLEVCGELRIGGRGEDVLSGELIEALGKQGVNATVVVGGISMGLIFGENKELAALAKTLDG